MKSAKTMIGLKGALIAILAICLLISVSTAQLGEIAGELTFAVQVGHSETLQMHLLNEGDNPIAVQMVPPGHLQLTSNATLSANQVAPTYMVMPINLTVPPHGESSVNVTIYMPLNDTPYLATWEGILSAQEVSNASNPGGAVIIEGVAKGFSIGAIPSTTTTTIAPPTTVIPLSSFTFFENELAPYIPLIIIALAIIIGVAYYFAVFSKKQKVKAKKVKTAKDKATFEKQDLQTQVAQLQKELKRLKGAPARRSARMRKLTRPAPKKRRSARAKKTTRTTKTKRRSRRR